MDDDAVWKLLAGTPDPDVKRALMELLNLRRAVRAHRDAQGHDRCWLDDVKLYRALPEGFIGRVSLPPAGEFLTGCRRFREQRQSPEAKAHDPLCPAVYHTGDPSLTGCTCLARTG